MRHIDCLYRVFLIVVDKEVLVFVNWKNSLATCRGDDLPNFMTEMNRLSLPILHCERLHEVLMRDLFDETKRREMIVEQSSLKGTKVKIFLRACERCKLNLRSFNRAYELSIGIQNKNASVSAEDDEESNNL